jgi:hypothetical protein
MPPAIGYGIVPALTVDDAVRLGRPPSVRVILIDGPTREALRIAQHPHPVPAQGPLVG